MPIQVLISLELRSGNCPAKMVGPFTGSLLQEINRARRMEVGPNTDSIDRFIGFGLQVVYGQGPCIGIGMIVILYDDLVQELLLAIVSGTVYVYTGFE